MPACPVCHADIDAAARTAGKCPSCGAKLLQLPQRTIAEIRMPQSVDEPEDVSDLPSHQTTIDLPLIDTAKMESDDTRATVDFTRPGEDDAEEEGGQPSTITFGDEKTVEWSPGSTDPDATLLASQWRDELKHNDPGATIKQRETVTGSYITSSSLIVKSRHVRSTGEVGTPITSPSDAPDYELLNIIGEGGMGVVYAARQSSIARTVALKMLKDEEGKNAAHRDKFISEAVVTGELDHPNIVPIYDLGANDEGALFYSMKRVKGTPWNKVIKKKSLDENLNILLRVADAVAFAHVNGVIHRDLKPENVMLGDFGEVLVMDWGLARVSAKFPQAAAVTQSDAMGGTPAYMAPEMATGPLEKITEASDVYLLGAILYEIVQGRPPHSGKTVMSCLFSAAKNEIARPDKSHELLDVALHAMANAPEDRYPDVPAFQAAVREYQAHSESIKLVGLASNNMAKAAEAEDYELYAKARYGLEESLTLWPENRRAESLLSAATLDYARLALKRGDFDLGAGLLDPSVPDHQEVLAQLQSGIAERESRQRRIKMLKGAVAALVASVVGIGTVAYVKVTQEKNRAVAAEADAVKSRDAALVAQKKEAEQREIAVANEKTANEQRTIAVANEKTANEQRAIAVANEKTANEQREIAVRAREQEEYQAYIARIGLTNAKIDENAFDRAAELLDLCPVGLRRWEWGRLNFLCHLDERTWHTPARIDGAAISPDGAHFATGDSDGKAVIWSLETGERQHEFKHGPYVHSVAFDETGGRLASGSIDGTVQVRSTADGAVIAEFPAHADGVMSVGFSPDGKWLLTSGYDNFAKLWNLADVRQPAYVFQGHSWWVCDAEFSPDGSRIVTAGQDGKAIVWERGGSKAEPTAPYHQATSFSKHRGPIYAAKFSPDGRQIATAGYDGRVLVWRPEEVTPVDIDLRIKGEPDPSVKFREFTGHRGPVRALAFDPTGRTLASGAQDNMVLIWDLASGAPLKSLRGHASHVRECAFSPDGELLLSAGRDAQVKLWRPDAYAEQRELAANPEERDAILAARFSPDGTQIVTAGRDRTATLWNADSLERVQRFQEGHDFLATAAVFFDQGSRLATGAGDGTVRVWDVATGGEIYKLEGTGRTAALAVSDDGRLIATGSPTSRLQIWNGRDGAKLQELGEEEGGDPIEITAACFAPGGELLATGDDIGRCRLWRRDATGQWSAERWLYGHSRTINAMTFADGGARLITASGDNTVGQWDVARGRELEDRVLKHPEWVGDVAVSADGRTALTGCDDGKVRLWSLDNAQLIRTIDPVAAELAISSVDMSEDGRLAAIASAAEGTVRLWDLAAGREITVAKRQGGEGAWLDYGPRSTQIWAARFAPEGRQLLAIGGNDARLFDLDDQKLAVRFSPSGVVASADMSPDGTRVVTGSWDRSAKIWDVATGRVIVKLDGVHQGEINSARYSPDGARILTASDDGTARLWDAASGQPLEPILRGHGRSRVRDACFSPDGSRILTVSNDKTGRVWDATTGAEQFQLVGHEFAVRCGAFNSDDGRFIITGSDDNTAIIWDAATGKALTNPATGEVIRLAGHTAAITSVALAPDGSRALTGSEDNLVKLWDAATAKEILTLAGHAEEVTSVSFSPDGMAALTSSRDGRTLVWPAVKWTAGDAVSQARGAARR